MLLVLAPVQTLAAGLNFDDHFKELLFKCCFFTNGMVTIFGNSVRKCRKIRAQHTDSGILCTPQKGNPLFLLPNTRQQNAINAQTFFMPSSAGPVLNTSNSKRSNFIRSNQNQLRAFFLSTYRLLHSLSDGSMPLISRNKGNNNTLRPHSVVWLGKHLSLSSYLSMHDFSTPARTTVIPCSDFKRHNALPSCKKLTFEIRSESDHGQHINTSNRYSKYMNAQICI